MTASPGEAFAEDPEEAGLQVHEVMNCCSLCSCPWHAVRVTGQRLNAAVVMLLQFAIIERFDMLLIRVSYALWGACWLQFVRHIGFMA